MTDTMDKVDVVTAQLHTERMGRLELGMHVAKTALDQGAEAQRKFIQDMRAKYSLIDADQVDSETGAIKRAPREAPKE